MSVIYGSVIVDNRYKRVRSSRYPIWTCPLYASSTLYLFNILYTYDFMYEGNATGRSVLVKPFYGTVITGTIIRTQVPTFTHGNVGTIEVKEPPRRAPSLNTDGIVLNPATSNNKHIYIDTCLYTLIEVFRRIHTSLFISDLSMYLYRYHRLSPVKVYCISLLISLPYPHEWRTHATYNTTDI